MIDSPEKSKPYQGKPKGGRRPGAGRKPSTVKGVLKKLPCHSAALILAEINAHDKWLKLLESKDEKIVLETLKYLNDQAYGKAKQAVEHSGGISLEHFSALSDEQLIGIASQLGISADSLTASGSA